MRTAALFVQLTFFTLAEPETVAKKRNRSWSRSAPSNSIVARGAGGRKSGRRRVRLLCKRVRLAVMMVLGAVVQFLMRVFTLIIGLLKLSYRKSAEYQAVRYCKYPLSPLTETRLFTVRRKILVLDLDETLIHSHHDGSMNPTTPSTPPDFIVRVRIECHPVRFFVYKRPHVDFFLSMVSQWYELVIFTASMEMYGMAVANKLEDDRNLFQRRFFRQHCTMDFNGYMKHLTTICKDLSSVFIIDNSPAAYRGNPENAIPIKSWFSDPHDTALLDLLPMLDALRFTNDVRSVLSRNAQLHSLW